MSVNIVVLVGRLGQDPELSEHGDGRSRCVFSLATSRFAGEGREERVDWHRIVCWGRTASTCGAYLAKGRQVVVEGRLSVRKWEDDGQPRRLVEVVAHRVTFVGPRPTGVPEAEGGALPF